jgi:hypothetical protein
MLKPTVVILCYGSEIAFERLGGLPEFLSGYRSLLSVPAGRRGAGPGARHAERNIEKVYVVPWPLV